MTTTFGVLLRIGGVTEVANLLGVSRQRLLKLRERADFPDPIGELAQGPVWDLEEIASWNGSGLGRSSSGRPRSDVAARTLGGRFVLETPIGQGGFADVYRAVDKKDGGTPVAVKILRDVESVDPEVIRRFRRELRLLEGMHHENVVPILGHADTDDEGIWYAMPLAAGSLVDFLPEITTNYPAILDLMRQVCAGLKYVHQRPIYHRDLKPANILLSSEGTWAISDFGLAVEVERQTTVLTSTMRAGLGTRFYTAPEQWRVARTADHRSDIYSLGKILQELVTGELPITNEMPPGILRPVVERATVDRPDARYQSVDDFFGAVERAIGERDTKWESAEDTARRLLERVRLPKPTDDDLDELLAWGLELDEHSLDDMEALSRVLPWLSNKAISRLWEMNSDGFRRLYTRYADYVESGGFSFEFCDVLADFGGHAVERTKDIRMLHVTLVSLTSMGYRHNRWHVRGVVTTMLQSIRQSEDAVAAAEALRAADIHAVRWTLNEFSLRSLHPTLRAGVMDVLDDSAVGL